MIIVLSENRGELRAIGYNTLKAIDVNHKLRDIYELAKISGNINEFGNVFCDVTPNMDFIKFIDWLTK